MPKRSSLASAYSRALGLDLAAGADLLRLAGRAALLGEERLGVGLGAQRLPLPRLRVTLDADAEEPGDALALPDALTHAVADALAGACTPVRSLDRSVALT